MQTPGQVLSGEHRYILKAIGALKQETAKIEKGAAVDYGFFSTAVDFIRNYADRFHHAKEEGILFRELMNKPTFPPGPVNVMLHEHELGRQYVGQLDYAIKEKDEKGVMAASASYASLLENHIRKEDTILFPMADKALEAKLQESILDEFAKVERKFTAVDDYISLANAFAHRR